MFGIGKKNKDSTEEECAFCVYAEIQKQETVYCKKRMKSVSGGDRCSSFEYDLLKRRPGKTIRFVGLDPEELCISERNKS